MNNFLLYEELYKLFIKHITIYITQLIAKSSINRVSKIISFIT